MSEDQDYALLASNVTGLLKTRQGRDFIWHVLDISGLYTTSFSSEKSTIEFMEGRRSIGLDVLQLLEDSDDTAYARLLLRKVKEKEGTKDDD